MTPAPPALMVVESVEKGSAEAISFLQIVSFTEFLELIEIVFACKQDLLIGC